MRYTKTPVVFLEIKEIPQRILDQFEEFLRQQMIKPLVRPSNGSSGHYSGLFTRVQLRQVENWLRRNGSTYQKEREEE